MSEFANAMEVFKLLDQSNCRECGEKTCLAFAGAVFQGRKAVDECPRIPPKITAKYASGKTGQQAVIEQEMTTMVEQLKTAIRALDLPSRAEALGGRIFNGKLVIPTLGKEVFVDKQANLSADIHLHPWLTIPLFNYILDCQGRPLTGRWVPFRELPTGKDFLPLFIQRCEKPLKKVADSYPDLFEDMVHLFNGRQVEDHYQADISLVLHPLPKVPLLVCYWRPDEGMGSNLTLFFDADTENNLNSRPLYSLVAGLVIMFEKISLRHGVL